MRQIDRSLLQRKPKLKKGKRDRKNIVSEEQLKGEKNIVRIEEGEGNTFWQVGCSSFYIYYNYWAEEA